MLLGIARGLFLLILFLNTRFETYISKLILKGTVRQHLSFNQVKLMFYAIGL